jgi:NDP-sugar pyrophosphorylase family protein
MRPRGHEAVVLIGGKATRLGRLTERRPKAMLPICGAPFLELLVAKLRRDGFDRIVLVGDCPRPEIDRLAAERTGRQRPIVQAFSADGTAPAIRDGLRMTTAEQVLCVNGDTILDVDYGLVLERQRRSSAEVTLVTTTRADAPNAGAVGVSGGGTVLCFDEGQPARPPLPASARRESNCGCYGLDVAAVHAAIGTDVSFETQTLPRLAAKGVVGAVSSEERYFADFGTPERLVRVARSGRAVRRIYGL